MKKAFDANVSRARPRVRLGLLGEPSMAELNETAVETIAERVAQEVSVHARPTPPVAQRYEPASVVPDLANTIRARVTEARAPKASAVAALQQALAAPAFVPQQLEAPVAVSRPRAAAAPAQVVEVQTAPAPHEELDAGERRDRLKERLKAVRENPRPEPLPDTVAEAGVLAVERISALQTELVKVRTLNLALTQDLEATRRQAERATEEARLRMDEARRLSSEMEGRAKLLNDLERELGALEGERNEALLALQESRQQLDAREHEKDGLKAEIARHQLSLAESLSEEERLASELEASYEAASALRRSTEALRTERDTLARQVSDLTRERAELLEARKALEAVHRALSQAVSR
ncbi:MAG: Extensin-like protein [Myxococcaceae bacterium]|nr:Extensin-like protein [Myxococcaceae bacterium]